MYGKAVSRTALRAEGAFRVVSGVLACSLLAACAQADPESAERAPVTTATSPTAPTAFTVRDDWMQHFSDQDAVGTFVLREVGSTMTEVSNLDSAERRRIPASTFKILNSAIILEAGVVADVDETVAWDGVTRGIPAWNMDHSLRSGIEVSAVWLYQDLARQVGDELMSDFVAASRYGNADTGGGIDQFWLDGDLRISPVEQVDFLARLEQGELPFRPDVVAAVLDILVREQGDDWSWSYKTGTSTDEVGRVGWIVGTTRQGDRVWAFALAMELDSSDNGDPADRIDIAGELLQAETALGR